jgi:hypothetical protein
MLGIWRQNRDSWDAKWGYFAPRWGFQFVLHRGGYFDQRWAVTFALIWGVFHFYFPWRTRLSEGCNTPQYGFAIHNNTFWIYTGGKYDESIGQCTGNDQWITWDLPFFSWIFDGHWIQDQNHEWQCMSDFDKPWDFRQTNKPWDFRQTDAYTETHPYTYVLNCGGVQSRTATCTIEKRKWHRKWFPFLTRTRQVIDIAFDDEVGERSGSWKGGCTGCSYDMIEGETIEACLRRMEEKRKF